MEDPKLKHPEEDKMSSISDTVNWIAIFISPVLIFTILAFIAAFSLDGTVGTIVGLLIFALGVALGIWFAEKARKKEGTTNFMTRLSSTTPQPKEEEEEEENAS